MKMNAERWTGLIFLSLGAILFWNNEKLQPSTFDLLGSKFFPRITCLAIMALSLMLLFFGKDHPHKPQETQRETPGPAILFVVLTGGYLLALEFGLGFLGTTIVYLALLIWMMHHFQWKALPRSIGMALAASYSFYYFFERVLLLLLP